MIMVLALRHDFMQPRPIAINYILIKIINRAFGQMEFR